MSGNIDNGGPAFPQIETRHSPITGRSRNESVGGMNLRDYAAIHSTQPGIAEIVQVAGFGWDGYRVYTIAEDVTGLTFDNWWRALSLTEKCDLSARVRYAQADAMLKARSA